MRDDFSEALQPAEVATLLATQLFQYERDKLSCRLKVCCTVQLVSRAVNF